MLSDNQILDLVKEHELKTILLQFVDIKGTMKSIAVPVNQISDILENRITFDGSSVSGFRDNETSDLFLYPDKSTFFIFPNSIPNLRGSARFICDICNSDGSYFAGCVRSNLKRVKQMALDKDYEMFVAPELEFFLFKLDASNSIIENEFNSIGYYDFDYSFEKENTILSILDSLEDIGYDIQALHHEAAKFQYEIDLRSDDILKTADNIITFKFFVKVIADYYGYKASFMPKPLYGYNGSGLHLNISLLKDGKDCLFNKNANNNISDIALFFVGSLLKNIKGVTAVLNPTINSYKRLVKDYEAPIYIAWSQVTRSALVRIVNPSDNSLRIELRSPDAAMNPYMGLAVILQCCLDGIRNRVLPPVSIEKNLFSFSSNEIKQRKIKSLPRNLHTALEEFEKSLVAKASLGDYIFSEFLSSKKIEWNDYRKQVTPWELTKYLDI